MVKFRSNNKLPIDYVDSLKKVVLGSLKYNRHYRKIHDMPVQKAISFSKIFSEFDKPKLEPKDSPKFINFGESAYFYVSSLIPHFVDTIETVLQVKKKVYIKDFHKLTSIEEVKPPNFDELSEFSVFRLKLNPVSLRYANKERGIAIYVHPSSQMFKTLLRLNLLNKALTINKKFDKNLIKKVAFYYEPGGIDYKEKTHTFTSSKGLKYTVKGYILNNFTVKMNLDKDTKLFLLELMYYGGIGGHTTHHFGFVYNIKGVDWWLNSITMKNLGKYF